MGFLPALVFHIIHFDWFVVRTLVLKFESVDARAASRRVDSAYYKPSFGHFALVLVAKIANAVSSRLR